MHTTDVIVESLHRICVKILRLNIYCSTGVPSHLHEKREERQSKISATVSNASIRGFKSPSNKRIIER